MADLITGEISAPPHIEPSKPEPRSSRVLAMIHGHPLGTVDLDTVNTDICNIRTSALAELSTLIEDHLVADGLSKLTGAREFADLPGIEQCASRVDKTPESAPLATVALATMSNAESCVKSINTILESHYSNLELLVVDNAPEDPSTREAIEKIEDPRVRYVAQQAKGLSRVRNRSIAEAKGEFIAFLDDDVAVGKYWLSAIVRTFCNDKTVACVTGSILAAELETPAQSMLEQFGGFNKGSQRQIFDMGEHRRESPLYPYASGRFGSGANMAFRMSALEEIGPFANDLGAGSKAHGGEDIDILRRVVSSGHVLVYEPAALMWHAHRRIYRALERQMFRYGVGLSATITKWMVESPATAWAIMRRVPAGLHYALSPRSVKNQNKAAHYPRQLTWLERAGFICGPYLYLRSRHHARRIDGE